MGTKNNNFLRNCISDREKLMKILLWSSIVLDIFLLLCFIIGFSLGMGSSIIGFFMVGMVFRYGLIIYVISIIFKFIVFILVFIGDVKEKKKIILFAMNSLIRQLFVGALIYGIYYIGKVMTYVG